MKELDILDYFYDVLRAEGKTRDTLFISLDETVLSQLEAKLHTVITLERLHELTDICIANQWLERTTADQQYRYVSLTEAGLQIAIANQYRNGV